MMDDVDQPIIIPDPRFANYNLFTKNIPALVLDNPSLLYLNAFYRADKYNIICATHRQIVSNPVQNIQIIRQNVTVPNWEPNYIS